MIGDPKPYVTPAFGREEKRYLLKAALLIAIIYVFRDVIFFFSGFFALFLPLFFFIFLWMKSINSGDRILDLLREQITLMPVPYTEGEGKKHLPRATIALILLNVVVYYLIEKSPFTFFGFIAANYTFLPHTATWWNIPVSPFTCMFMHADAGHLWSNMGFLWAFGPAVEERLGTKKYVWLYLATGLLGSLTAVAVARVFFSEAAHGWGASGAVSGVMGIFMIRCYFKKLVIPLPLLGLVNFKLRVNSLLPLGLYFLLNLRGGFAQLAGSHSSIGFWAHIGSIAAGMLLALRLKLHAAAAEEKYTAAGMDAIDNPGFLVDGESSLRAALALNPENETALLGMARLKAVTRTPEGRELYQKAIRLAIRSSPKRAGEIYHEYFSAYNRMLEPDLQYRLAGILYNQGEHEPAARSLEMVIAEPSGSDAVRAGAFLQLILILAENGMQEPARYRLRQFEEIFPASPLLESARAKVAGMCHH